MCEKKERKKGNFRKPSNDMLVEGFIPVEDDDDVSSVQLCNVCYQDLYGKVTARLAVKRGLRQMQEECTSEDSSTPLMKAKGTVMSEVAGVLLQGNGILLSTVHDMLNSELGKLGSQPYRNVTRVREWLTEKLGAYADIKYVKSGKRAGYVITGKECDVVQALHNALYENRNWAASQVTATSSAGDISPTAEQQAELDSLYIKPLSEAMFNQARQWEPLRNVTDLSTVCLNTVIKNMDNRLWKLVWYMTSPQSRRQSAMRRLLQHNRVHNILRVE